MGLVTVINQAVLSKRSKRAATILPQTASGNLFNVVNGRIRVTSITGVVTVVFPATINSIKLVATPTVGAVTDICAAVSIASAAVASVVAITGTFAAVATVNANGAHVAQASPVVLTAGTLAVNATGSSATGQIEWVIIYDPIDPNAFVTNA